MRWTSWLCVAWIGSLSNAAAADPSPTTLRMRQPGKRPVRAVPRTPQPVAQGEHAGEPPVPPPPGSDSEPAPATPPAEPPAPPADNVPATPNLSDEELAKMSE